MSGWVETYDYLWYTEEVTGWNFSSLCQHA